MERKFSTSTCSGDCAHCGANAGADFTKNFSIEIPTERFRAFSQDGKLAVFDSKTGRVYIGLDIANLFDERGTIFIDNGVRLPNAGSVARSWEELSKKVVQQLQEQVSQIMAARRSPVPPKIEVVFPASNRTPEEELERTQKLLEPDKTEVLLTVGDLSAHTARKKEADRRWAQNSVNQDPRMTVGDLTPAHDQGKGLDELFVGRPAHRFPTTESQKLLEEKYENDAKKADVRFRVQNPSIKEKALDALELIPKIKATLAEAEREREEQRKEDAWREVEKQLRAKGITI
jgi:hypothetical protein